MDGAIPHPAPQPRDEIPFVRCLTPGCDGTPLRISPAWARAHIEHFLRDDPSFQLKLTCSDCGRESRYSLDAIVGMIPASRRPRALRADEMHVLLLLEVETDAAMVDRAFVGERVLAKGRSQSATGGLAELRSAPALAPALVAGDVLRFEHWGRYLVGRSLIAHSGELPIQLELGKTSNAIGVFLASKHEARAALRPGNIFCSNPSCVVVFALTYSEFTDALGRAHARAPSLGASKAMIFLTCAECGTSRVVDERTFEGIEKA